MSKSIVKGAAIAAILLMAVGGFLAGLLTPPKLAAIIVMAGIAAVFIVILGAMFRLRGAGVFDLAYRLSVGAAIPAWFVSGAAVMAAFSGAATGSDWFHALSWIGFSILAIVFALGVARDVIDDAYASRRR